MAVTDETERVWVGEISTEAGGGVLMWAGPKEMELIRLAFAGGAPSEIARLRVECGGERPVRVCLDRRGVGGGSR